ncbi:TolC family outer membrane protein [Pseudomonas sp. S9]|uniref:TolC family outer membrane protein n=1 Tax=Pseudomonas sp. S9 TaxID=686578 RepID=UPI000A072CBA|nr:TolC family outer membrane protein [Pseudomonas sp. S9]
MRHYQYFNRFAWAVLVGACGSFISTAVAAEPLSYDMPELGDAQTMTLRESVIQAFSHDPTIARMVAQVGIGPALIDEAESAWKPQIGLQSGFGGAHGRLPNEDDNYTDKTYGVTLTQLVYDFGKTHNNILQQRSIKQGYIHALQQSMGEVAGKTARTYLLIKRFGALKRAAEQGVQSLRAVDRIARVRSSSGLSSSSDHLQAQSRIASMQSQVEQFSTQRETAIAQLEVLTGVRAVSYATPPVALNEQIMQVAAIDYSGIAAVKRAMAEYEAAVKVIAKNKAGYLPTLKLEAGRTRYQNKNDPYWDNQLYLNLDVPLYTGGAVSARIAQAEGAKAAAEQNINKAKFDAMSNASVAHSNYTGSRSNYAVSARQFEMAKRARGVYLDEYKLSRRSVNDLISVEQDLYQSHLALLNAEFDSWDAAVDYASAVDRLIDVLGIYTPEAPEGLPDI